LENADFKVFYAKNADFCKKCWFSQKRRFSQKILIFCINTNF
jgi:hypothetical protein